MEKSTNGYYALDNEDNSKLQFSTSPSDAVNLNELYKKFGNRYNINPENANPHQMNKLRLKVDEYRNRKFMINMALIIFSVPFAVGILLLTFLWLFY